MILSLFCGNIDITISRLCVNYLSSYRGALGVMHASRKHVIRFNVALNPSQSAHDTRSDKLNENIANFFSPQNYYTIYRLAEIFPSQSVISLFGNLNLLYRKFRTTMNVPQSIHMKYINIAIIFAMIIMNAFQPEIISYFLQC